MLVACTWNDSSFDHTNNIRHHVSRPCKSVWITNKWLNVLSTVSFCAELHAPQKY